MCGTVVAFFAFSLCEEGWIAHGEINTTHLLFQNLENWICVTCLDDQKIKNNYINPGF